MLSDFLASPTVTGIIVVLNLFTVSFGIVLAFNAIVDKRTTEHDRIVQFLFGVAAVTAGLAFLIWPDWTSFLDSYPPTPTGGIH